MSDKNKRQEEQATKTSKVLPCPCCKGFSVVDREDVFCTECGLNLKINDFIYRGEAENYEQAREMAIEQWNTRKPMQDIVEQLEAEIESSDKYIREYDDSKEQIAFNKGMRHCAKIAKEISNYEAS